MDLSPEDAEARDARPHLPCPHSEPPHGAAVRDLDGRTYAAATVAPAVAARLGALDLAVAMAVSSGANGPRGRRAGDRAATTRSASALGARVRRLTASPSTSPTRRAPSCTVRVHMSAHRRLPLRLRLLRRAAQRRQVHADQRPRRRQDRDHLLASRRPRATPSAGSSTATTPSWSWSTPPACTSRARCWASGSTTSSARRGPRSTRSGMCLPANERIGPGDRFLIREIARAAPQAGVRHRDQDRPRHARPPGASTCWPSSRRRRGRPDVAARSCRSRPSRASRSTCWPTC